MFQFTNNAPDSDYLCPDTGTIEIAYTDMAFSAASAPGQTFEVISLDTVVENLAIGASDFGVFECCVLDPADCLGYTETCTTSQFGVVPCSCSAPTNWSVTANSCATQVAALCN
jgi:hypothetical protein